MLQQRALGQTRVARAWAWAGGLAVVLLLAACGGPSTPSDVGAAPAAKAALARLAPRALAAAWAGSAASRITAAQLMDWAQTSLPDVFPGQATTVVDQGFVYRVYARTGNLLAVMDDGRVFAVLADSGTQPRYLGLLDSYACQVTASACGPGDISLLAGSAGGPGYLDGQGSAARFNQPLGVAVDRDGNLLVADASNHALRQLTPDGRASTLALLTYEAQSSRPGSQTIALSPTDVVADPLSGAAYVSAGNSILKVSAQGAVSVFAGSPLESGSRDGTGADARFYGASGPVMDNQGNLFVADSANHLVRKVTPGGKVSSVAGTAGQAGSADGAGSTQARLAAPSKLSLGGDGTLYVLDQNGVRKLSSEGMLSTWLRAGGMPNGAAWANALAVDADGNLYLARAYQATVDKVTPDGRVTVLAGQAQARGTADGTGGAARFIAPAGLAVGRQSQLYVTETSAVDYTPLGSLSYEAHTVRAISPQGQVTTLAGAPRYPGWRDGGGTAAQFNAPHGMVVGTDGMLYVADTNNAVVRRVSPAGEVSTLAGSPGQVGTQDGQGAEARFSAPTGIAVDSAGNLYVTDSMRIGMPTGPGFPTGVANTVRKITPDGRVSTLAGNAGTRGAADGQGPAASFAAPQGIAVDTAGNLFVADMGNQAIRKITPAGQVSTLLKTARFSSTPFVEPTSVAVDGAGNLYVTDAYRQVIQLTPGGQLTQLASTWTGTAAGADTYAGLGELAGIAADADGTLYLGDGPEGVAYPAGNGVASLAGYPALPIKNEWNTGYIWQVTPAGQISKRAGSAAGTELGNKLGPAPGVLDRVQAVASDGHGTLYVSTAAGILKLGLR